MSYYLLPSKKTLIDLNFTFEDGEYTRFPYISPSLENYINIMEDEMVEEKETLESGYTIDFFKKTINPYEYIFTKVPGTKFSVGKMKPFSAKFYTFLEMIHILNLFDTFYHRKIRIILFGSNSTSMSECIDILRENYNDSYLKLESTSESHSVDFLYFELDDELCNDPKYYFKTILKFIANILQFQTANGVSVIKVSSIAEKPILESIYLLTSLYEKVYIIKPNSSDLFSREKFIVCKNYNFSLELIQYYLREINNIWFCILDNKIITSITKKSLPYYFLNKIEEANVIIGHQQLDIMEQLANLIKNKNREDKIESLNKHNIQKCIQWCEKYKIPYNKFVEKVNIFLIGSSIVEDEFSKKNEYLLENDNIVLHQ